MIATIMIAITMMARIIIAIKMIGTKIANSADMAIDEIKAADSPITIKTIAAKNISIPRSV